MLFFSIGVVTFNLKNRNIFPGHNVNFFYHITVSNNKLSDFILATCVVTCIIFMNINCSCIYAFELVVCKRNTI